LIARPHQWADENCAHGFCSRCGICPELQRRQQMIADLLHEPDLLAAIRGELKSIRDIERATGRLSQASGNARDLVALKTSLQQVPKLKRELQS